MKNTKRARRAAAFAAAVVMAACAAVPMGSSFSASAAGNNSITIDGFNTTENNDLVRILTKHIRFLLVSMQVVHLVTLLGVLV